MILRIAYGYAAANYDDEMIAMTNHAMDTFNAVSDKEPINHLSLILRLQASKPGAFLVNQLPFREHSYDAKLLF